MATKKVGVILCDSGYIFGGENALRDMYINAFQRNGNETWDCFEAWSGQLPNMSMIDNYKAIIISGSSKSVNSGCKWVHDLEIFIKDLFTYQCMSNAALKVVGICFGHQIIGKALGAKVVKNVLGKFIFRQVGVHVSPELKLKPYFQKIFGEKKTINLFQSHEEEVVDLPIEGRCIASSDYCENEIILYGGSILTLQGHMDITIEQMINIVLPIIRKDGLIGDKEEAEMWQSIREIKNDRSETIQMIQEYIS